MPGIVTREGVDYTAALALVDRRADAHGVRALLPYAVAGVLTALAEKSVPQGE